jgi:hypothetical protein
VIVAANCAHAAAVSRCMMHRLSALLAIVAIVAIACSSMVTEPAPVVDGDARETASIQIGSNAARTLVATLTLENFGATDRQILWVKIASGTDRSTFACIAHHRS